MACHLGSNCDLRRSAVVYPPIHHTTEEQTMSHDSDLTPLSDAKRPLFIGIDLGGTNIKFGLVDDAGCTVDRTETPTDAKAGPDAAVKRMAEAIDQLATNADIGKDAIARVGLATPGTMDIPAGMLLVPPNLKGWEHYPIRDRLRDACGLPVSFNNDANAAAFGEDWVGRGRAYHSMVLLTLGTGVGGGIVIGGEVLDGEHSHGAECGHVIVDYRDSARVCGCGGTGHLEAYASATAVVKRTIEALDRGSDSSLREPWQAGKKITSKMLYEHAKQQDALSMDLILETAMYLGVGITCFMHVIDPDAVVLAGAMDFGGSDDEVGRRFLSRIREEVKRRAFPVLAERTVIDFASLGGNAGYLGAAGIARAEHMKTEV